MEKLVYIFVFAVLLLALVIVKAALSDGKRINRERDKRDEPGDKDRWPGV